MSIRRGQIVLGVGGVGYLVAVTQRSGFGVGSQVSLHTYLAVRENALELYGFLSQEELRMFEELIKLPKIGPKTAMQILSQADLKTLMHSVHTDDPAYLSKMSGIGKKSAEKIVAGLKEVLDIETFGDGRAANQQDADIIDALIALGYSQRDVVESVQKLPKNLTDTNSRIKQALKILSK
jgi:Holliday junction DNA helicase RuvA